MTKLSNPVAPTGLPDDLKSMIENLSGMSLDKVKVHYNSNKPAQLNAFAYTQGNDIHLAPGQEKQLPHEAWHVVQQAQGRVSASERSHIGLSQDEATRKTQCDLLAKQTPYTSRN
jgi:hypothetical protein